MHISLQQISFDPARNSILLIGFAHFVGSTFYHFQGIADCDSLSAFFYHFQIIIIVSEGNDVVRTDLISFR